MLVCSWSTLNELNSIFGDFLSHFVLFWPFVLLVFLPTYFDFFMCGIFVSCFFLLLFFLFFVCMGGWRI